MKDQSSWPHVCEKCDGRTVLYDSRCRYEDYTHAGGYNLYVCTQCGHMQYKQWEVVYEITT